MSLRDEAFLHNAGKEQRPGCLDRKLSSQRHGRRGTSMEAKTKHVSGSRKSCCISRVTGITAKLKRESSCRELDALDRGYSPAGGTGQ
jgi:hypothetical protein